MNENPYLIGRDFRHWSKLDPYLQAKIVGHAERYIWWDDYGEHKRQLPQNLFSPEDYAAWMQHIEQDEDSPDDDGSTVNMIHKYVFERLGPDILSPVTVKFEEKVWRFYYEDAVEDGHEGPNLEPLCAAFDHSYVWDNIVKIQMKGNVENDSTYEFRFIRRKDNGQYEKILVPDEFKRIHISDHDNFVECFTENLQMKHRMFAGIDEFTLG